MKKVVSFLLVMAMMIFMVSLASAAEVVLRLADTQPETYPATAGCVKFAELVAEKSEGRIEIQVLSGGQLGGDEKAIIEQVQFGAIDFARVNLAPMAEFSPMLNLLQMPYLFSGTDHLHAVIDSDLGKEMLKGVESNNFTGMALYDAGIRNFYNSVRPITSMADMKGLKIRTTQSALMMDAVEALGATPTPMAYGEVYSSLQTGVIDGAENTWTSYDQNSHCEVAKYITMDAHNMPPEILIGSKMVMDRLSAEDQQLIYDCAKESELWERGMCEETLGISRQVCIDKGCEISELTDRDAWIEAMKPIYEKYAADFLDALAQIQSMQ